MRVKALSVAAVVALAGVAALSATSIAQEKEDTGGQVRVFAFGQGSYLGVFISDVTSADVQKLGLPEERGVRITGVADEGPARDAGLEEDDVILRWNGESVESEAQLRRLLAETPAGRSVTLGVFRDGSERSIKVQLGDRDGPAMLGMRSGWDEDQAAELRRQLESSRDRMGDVEVRLRKMPQVMSFMSMRGGRLGVGIQSLEPQLADFFGLGDRTGVLITTVREDSPAAAGGLKAGDVIVAIGGENVEDPGDVSRLVWDAEQGPLEIRVLRDRSERKITVELPEAENTWRSEDGEMNGFFFSPEDFDTQDFRVEWAKPIRELSRLRVLGAPEGPVNWVPFQTVRPVRRSLSI
ncbi:MAG: PDZ domain-containing protein [Candidatus Palauibacterales bacterium]|nr:PDZ domain-containing protein [Candidatus Palauibacterales bacterium]